MKNATSIALHEYWQSCHRRNGVPAGEIRAAELAPILTSLFLVDLDLAAGLRFRFCGAAIAGRYGRDLTDESLLALWDAEDRETLARDIRVIALRANGLVAGIVADTVGAGCIALEMLLLPLAGGAGATGVIGSLARTGGHDDANRIRARIVGQTLRSVRFLPAADGERPRIAASAWRPSATARAVARRQYGHLTVVAGGK